VLVFQVAELLEELFFELVFGWNRHESRWLIASGDTGSPARHGLIAGSEHGRYYAPGRGCCRMGREQFPRSATARPLTFGRNIGARFIDFDGGG
jgi:hypothetical protein